MAQQAQRELARKEALPAVDAAAIGSDLSVLGRFFLVTREQGDIASFKTPGLRNVLVTGPYFHDGSMQTLWDVMDHYNKGDGITNPWLDKDMQPLALTEPEIDDIVAFLASLTSSQYKELGDQEYARQLALSRVSRSQQRIQSGHSAQSRSSSRLPHSDCSLILRNPAIEVEAKAYGSSRLVLRINHSAPRSLPNARHCAAVLHRD